MFIKMKITKVQDNIKLLKKFIINIDSNFFRYYDKRNLECLKNHKYTILGIVNEIPIAYGHLDIENDNCWLGICVLKKYHSRGYGKIIINNLINYYNLNLEKYNLVLTVDEDNINAINFYKKYNFISIENKDCIIKMKYIKMDKIDLVYPCHSKDKNTIDLAIEYARKNIQNLNNIYVVSKTKLTDNAIWVSEDIFPFTFQDMIDIIGDHWRTGWYYAGWIHLYSSIYIPNILENVLICDSDTIFIRPVTFIDNEGRALFNISPSDGTPLYLEHMSKLVTGLNLQLQKPWSGVAHHIVMNRTILKDMMNRVEEKFKVPFWKAWINVTLENYRSCPQEKEMKNKHIEGPGRATSYELYFNYALKYFPDKAKIRKLNSIMSYKGFINVRGENLTKGEKSRTNLQGVIQIIDPLLEKQKVFDSVEESLRWHISKCVEKGFDSVTFQNHQRDGITKHRKVAKKENR